MWVVYVYAVMAIAAVVGGASVSISSSSIADLTVAISSMKFSGDMQWSYDRNIRAAVDATATAGLHSSPKCEQQPILNLVLQRAEPRPLEPKCSCCPRYTV